MKRLCRKKRNRRLHLGPFISSAGQAEGEGQGAELQVKAEGQHMEQPEGQSEQSGKQPGTDQKMDVEVTQLQTGGDQRSCSRGRRPLP